MALRKFKKLMVPLSVLFIAAMLIPIFLKIGESIRAGKTTIYGYPALRP